MATTAATPKLFARWTAAEHRRLRDLATEGLDVRAIADRLNRTPSGVKWQAAQLGIAIQMADAWTAEQDDVVRRHYGHLPTGEIATLVGRSENAVGQRAQKLGLKHPRGWSAADVDVLRREYPTGDPAAIAARVGRPLCSVYVKARLLGLRAKNYVPPYSAEQIERVRVLHAEGLTDLAIAAATSIDRLVVNKIRHKLGLPVITDPTAKKRGVANQLKTLGLSHPFELRDRAFRLYAVENGWPEDLRPREVQILNALVAADRPMTRLELAKAIGMRTDRHDKYHTQPVLLSGNGPGGTYTATLQRRGLVHRINRYTGGGRGKIGRLPSQYVLTPLAIEMRVRWQAQRTQEQPHVGTSIPQSQASPSTDTRPGARRMDPVPA